MADIIHLEQLLQQLKLVREQMLATCRSIAPALFFSAPEGKWNAAEQIKHLTISATSTRTAYKLPKFIIRLYVGKPNRASRSFEELKDKYHQKLDAGGKANKRFIPAPARQADDMARILQAFEASMIALENTIRNKWNDQQLDEYIAPHPLLGKITQRELIYFTIFHTQHHEQSILKLTGTGISPD